MRDQRCLYHESIAFSCLSDDTGPLSLTQINSICNVILSDLAALATTLNLPLVQVLVLEIL
jgi:hypothetical protein